MRMFWRGAGKPAAQPDDDDSPFLTRDCFVIMPFGEKLDLSDAASTRRHGITLQPGANIKSIDFDRIYEKIIKPAIGDVAIARLNAIRSDEIERAGFIHGEMLRHVVSADVAIVDITTQNANVFYELGVRHCFRRSTTVIIRRKGTTVPFNITGMRVFEYDDDEATGAEGKSALQQSRESLTEIISQSFTYKGNDSLVHALMPNISVQRSSFALMDQRWVVRPLVDLKDELVGKEIGFVTGDIMQIRDIDAWINPENTQMEMARLHDGSVSSLIRYYGAKRRRCGRVRSDVIRDSLLRRAGQNGVEAGAVLVTPPGALRGSNNVKALFHLAGLQGEPGYGYQPVRDYPNCLRRALREVERYNDSIATVVPLWRPALGYASGGIESVLVPLFGSRSGVNHPQEVAGNLFKAAASFLEQSKSPTLKQVWFLAYTEQDRQACEAAMGLLANEGHIRRSQTHASAEPASKPPPGTSADKPHTSATSTTPGIADMRPASIGETS